MRYFFQDTFVHTVKSLLKKNSYKDCEQALIAGVFSLSKVDLFAHCTANRLNKSGKNPIVKMRIAHKKSKRSSYRLYFFIIQRKDALYFGHLYPKTGNKGIVSLSVQEENEIIKSLLNDIKAKKLAEVYSDKAKNKICYSNDNTVVW